MTAAREAKARLTDMNVQEVSLVDKAANLRVFAITKRANGTMAKLTKAEFTAAVSTLKGKLAEKMKKLRGDAAAGVKKLDFKLPTDAKQSIMDGLAECLDKLTALATMVGDAQVDDQAPVPTELSGALMQIAEMLEGIGSQYGGGEPAAGTGDQAPPGQGANPAGPEGAPPEGPAGKRLAKGAVVIGKAELDNFTAASVTIDAARTQLWSATDMMGKDPAAAAEKLKAVVGMLDNAAQFLAAGQSGAAAAPAAPAEGDAAKAAKALAPELHDGDSLKTELHDGDSLKELLHKAIAAGHTTTAALTKAGRKMAAARYEKLKGLHDELGKLLADLAFAENADAAGAGEAEKAKKPKDKEEPAGGAAPPAPPAPAAKGAEGDAMAALQKKLDDSVAAAAAERVKLEKRVEELAKHAGLPVSQPVEGGGPPPAEVSWPTDMSAAVKKKAADKAKSGGK